MQYRLKIEVAPLTLEVLQTREDVGVLIASQFDAGNCDGVATRKTTGNVDVCVAFGDFTIIGHSSAEELNRNTLLRDVLATFQKVAPDLSVRLTLSRSNFYEEHSRIPPSDIGR